MKHLISCLHHVIYIVVGGIRGGGGIRPRQGSESREVAWDFVPTSDSPKCDCKYRKAEVLSALKYFVNTSTA